MTQRGIADKWRKEVSHLNGAKRSRTKMAQRSRG